MLREREKEGGEKKKLKRIKDPPQNEKLNQKYPLSSEPDHKNKQRWKNGKKVF